MSDIFCFYTIEYVIELSDQMLMPAVTCSEPDLRIDPSQFFNLTANSELVKTAGGRVGTAVDELYAMDQAAKIGMIVVLQHTGEDPCHCAKLPQVSQPTLRLSLVERQ